MTGDDRLLHALRSSFGLHDFREGQREIIEAILDGQDVVAVMPTGGGKSLCYQLPALLLPGLTIVVSPLIALMKDQVDALAERGLPATFINSTLSPEDQNRNLARAANGQVKLLYVAPERFRSLQFMRTLAGIDVSLFAVDEAHCLSQWGHDFRPDYLKLEQAIAALGRPAVAAFTATATLEVREDIAHSLKLMEPATFFAGVDRPNLFLAFKYPSGKGGHEKKFRELLQTIRRFPNQTGLIYASTRKNVEKIYDRLKFEGIRALPYHAGLDDAARADAQDRFMQGGLQAIVATNAFGMGVDKADIRYVIHYDFPGSIEAYYQEVGRAGRDGEPAVCLTLFSYADRFIQEFFHKGSNPPRELIEEVHQVLCGLPEGTIELTVAEITAKLKNPDNEMAVSTSLKVLERYGVISRGYRGEARAYVRTRFPQTTLAEALSRAPVQRAVAEALFAVAFGDVSLGAEIDMGALAYEAGIGREQVSRVLLELQRGGHIDYEPPFRGRSTRVLRRDSELPIDWSVLEEKAARDFEKIDMMMAFGQTEACRKWFLRQYFMGDGGRTWCGSCDRCANRREEEGEAAAEQVARQFERARRARGRDTARQTEHAGRDTTHRVPARQTEHEGRDTTQRVPSQHAETVGSDTAGRVPSQHAETVGSGTAGRTHVRRDTAGRIPSRQPDHGASLQQPLLDANPTPTSRGETGASMSWVTELEGAEETSFQGKKRKTSGFKPEARPAEGDTLLLIQKVLACVARMRGGFGRIRVAQVLKGSKDKEILRWQLDQLSTYGLLADLRIEDITDVIDVLLNAGLLSLRTVDEENTHRLAVVELTEKGREVMLGRAQVSLVLPENALPERERERIGAGAGSGGGGWAQTGGGAGRGAGQDAGRGSRQGSGRGSGRGAGRGDRSLAGAFHVRGGLEEEKSEGPYSSRVYNAIVRWRARRASEKSVPPYIVLNNQTARDLARVCPTSRRALEQVKGMGPVRCDMYGQELLEIIEKYAGIEADS